MITEVRKCFQVALQYDFLERFVIRPKIQRCKSKEFQASLLAAVRSCKSLTELDIFESKEESYTSNEVSFRLWLNKHVKERELLDGRISLGLWAHVLGALSSSKNENSEDQLIKQSALFFFLQKKHDTFLRHNF